MIVAEQKPIEEIMAMIPPVDNLLVLGCDTCVAVCLAGGEKEVKVLSAAIRMSGKAAGGVKGATIERQCDREFFGEITEAVQGAGAILSMACGAGIQMLADAFPDKIVLPAVNTLFMGSNEDAGYWLERCLGCGDCVLDLTAGICPRTRCSKGLMNGPCGGSENGKCEVDPQNLDCGWNLIYQRLKAMNQLDRLMEIQPPQDWSKTHDGGPRRLIREDVKL
jgi:ferredoxin